MIWLLSIIATLIILSITILIIYIFLDLKNEKKKLDFWNELIKKNENKKD